MEKAGRNDPCPCGSGKKFKKCCEVQQKKPKKIHAEVLTQAAAQSSTQETARLSSLFFQQKAAAQTAPTEPPNPIL